MKITLKKRSGNYLDTFEVTESTTVDEFKDEFYKKYHYYPERQWWNVGKVTGKPLKDGTLADSGVSEGTFLYFKDMGVQISWRLVFVLEYLGPLLIFPLFYFVPQMYGVTTIEKSFVQKVSFALALFHFFKREMETLFVHRFSNATMPIFRVPLNCGHYWGLFGAAVGYYIFHPRYASFWRDDQVIIIYGLTIAMLAFELLNFKTHLILRHLRPRGTKVRGIPRGWGFDTVSCANYFWETLTWISYSLLVCSFTAWLFTFVAFLQMAQWALKKHSLYLKSGNYPRSRKAMIPFLL